MPGGGLHVSRRLHCRGLPAPVEYFFLQPREQVTRVGFARQDVTSGGAIPEGARRASSRFSPFSTRGCTNCRVYYARHHYAFGLDVTTHFSTDV